MQYIDLHCDTLMQAFVHEEKDIFSMPYAMLDLKRLKESGAAAQFFAIFLPPPGAEKLYGPLPTDDEYIQSLAQILDTTVQNHPALLAKAGNAKELEQNKKDGKISAFLTIEDGRSVDGSLEKLEAYYNMGVRLISLTWNYANCFGFPNSKDAGVMKKGLTAFGKEGVRRMNELGMLVDVSHLSDGGFRDVADICKGPFVASHSNCRALSPHPRNLTDDMIRTLAEHGGVMGLNFAPGFLHADITKKQSRMEEMALHVQHMIKYGGEECIALGTDFDGIEGEFEVASPLDMEKLFDYLKKSGLTESQLEKMAYKNAGRVIKDVMK